MTSPGERHIGFVTTNDVSPLVESAAKAREAMALIGDSVDESSAAVRRAAAAVVTATSEENRARATQRLAVLQVTDVLNAQAAAAGLAARASADAAALEVSSSETVLRAMQDQAAAWEAAQGREAVSTEALRLKVVAANAQIAASATAMAREQADAAAKVDAADAAKSSGSALATGAGAAGIAALAVGALGVESLKAASQFQQSTELFRTQAGQAQAQVASLRTQIVSLAQQVAFSPNSLATAMFAVTSAGYTSTDAINVQRAAAEGAKVGNADLTQTTDALVGVMRSLGQSGGDATQTMSELNAIVGSGKMTMDQLNAALGTGVVPAVAAAGVNLRSLGAALSFMTDAGTPADAAATRLRATVALIADPSTKAAKALGAIGLAGPDVTAATQTMANALAKSGIQTTQLADDLRKPDGIQVALLDLKQHLQDAGVSADVMGSIIGKAFGGGKSDAATLELINNLDSVKQKYDDIGNSAGQFGSDVTATAQTASYQYAQLKADIDVVGVQLGTVLLPIAIKVGQGLTQAFSSLENNHALLSKVAETAQFIAEAFTSIAPPVITVFKDINDAVLDDIHVMLESVDTLGKYLPFGIGSGLNQATQEVGQFKDNFDSTLTAAANDAQNLGAAAGRAFGSAFLSQEQAASKAAVIAQQNSNSSSRGLDPRSIQTGAAPTSAGNSPPSAGVTSPDLSSLLSPSGNGSVGTGGYSAPSGGGGSTAAPKAVDQMAQSISSLNASEGALRNQISAATKGTQDQQIAAQQAAQSLLSQATSNVYAATTAKDHTAAIRSQTTAARELAQINEVLAKSDINKTAAAQAALNARSAPNASGVTGAQATLVYDEATKKSAASLLKEAEASEKAKHNAADHALTVRELAAAQASYAKASQDVITATQAVTAAQQQARQDAVDLANAMQDVSLVGATPLATAQTKLAEATRQLGIDTAGTTQYFKDLAAQQQANLDIANALNQAQQDSVDLANAKLEAGLDPSDANAAASAKVQEARNQLAIDTPGTVQWFKDQAALNQATYALTQSTSSAATALAGLSSTATTILPSYMATRLAATSGSYIGGSGGSSMSHTVTVNLAGATIIGAGGLNEVANALAGPIATQINNSQRQNGKPLLSVP